MAARRDKGDDRRPAGSDVARRNAALAAKSERQQRAAQKAEAARARAEGRAERPVTKTPGYQRDRGGRNLGAKGEEHSRRDKQIPK